MAKNDDYNPENDPKYAVDKAMADKAYWEMRRRKANQMSFGSVGWPKGQNRDIIPSAQIFEGTPNFLPPEVISVGSIGVTRRQNLEIIQNVQVLEARLIELVRLSDEAGIDVETALADIPQKRRIYPQAMGVALREMPDLQFGRNYRTNYHRGQETKKRDEDDDTVPF